MDADKLFALQRYKDNELREVIDLWYFKMISRQYKSDAC